jgi:hypothetical protein
MSLPPANSKNLLNTGLKGKHCNNEKGDLKGNQSDGIGEPCWTRTSDPLLKRQMLCRLS